MVDTKYIGMLRNTIFLITRPISLFFANPTNIANANNSMFARLGTDYEIRNQWFFAILEAMTTD